MAVKPKRRPIDPHRALRDRLVKLLGEGHAHVTFKDAIADWPPELQGTKPPGQPFTPWRLLEHIRISQWDILDFTRNPKYESPAWPAGDCPPSNSPPYAKPLADSLAQPHPDPRPPL